MKKIALFFGIIFFCHVAYSQGKQKIEKAEDLPKHNYQLEEMNVAMLLKDNDKLLKLAEAVKKDLKSDLEKYEFGDKSILKEYYGNLMTIAHLEGDYQQALNYLQQARKLADKESEQLIRSCEYEAYARALKESPELEGDELADLIKKNLLEILDPIPFDKIQETVESRKGRADIYTQNLITGYVEGELQDVVDNSKGYIPLDIAAGILGIRSTQDYYIPYTGAYSEVMADLLKRKAVEIAKVDIWADRNVSLKVNEGYSPIVVGIWDTGVDVDLFPGKNIWTNKKEKVNGKDDDNNGYVDDIHGVAYDYEGRKSTDLLIPEAHQMEDLAEMQEMDKGLIDLIANKDSEPARKLKEATAKMSPEEYEAFFEVLNLLGTYNHGTHVAGIALEGNPFAQVLVARLTFDWKNMPDVLTMETAERWAKMYEDVISYFEVNNVRVVNMSWSVDIRIDILPTLQKNGVGNSEEERVEIARKMFAVHEKAFSKAMEGAPGILFVTSAGNSNNDVDFAGSVPSSFNFPNILTVGAVDIEGKKTSFTTEGESVDVFANGYEVESYIPGGDRVQYSGTSMSSPNVVNLAAKILAVNPGLSALEVKRIIIDNATPSSEDPKVLLINPKKSVEAARKML
ncbi:MAG: S8 family serine peptidase [Bacteroidales bacterium]|nr:S8 family serine peptidase [Bacteroidales bacterium]